MTTLETMIEAGFDSAFLARVGYCSCGNGEWAVYSIGRSHLCGECFDDACYNISL